MGLFGQNPGSIGFAAPPDETTQLRRLRDLERGVQEAYADGTLRSLVDSLPASVATQVASQLAGGISTTTVAASGTATIGGDINLTGDLYSVHGLNTPVTSGYFAAYFNSDGRLGRTTSAKRYKQEIAACTPDIQAVFALQLVTYRLKAAVAEMGNDAPIEHGLIAEELVALGLEWLVTYIDGVVEGVAYEKLALALLPAIQNHEKRLLALEARL